MMSEYDRLVEQIRGEFTLSPKDIVLPTPLGTIKVGDLPFLKGWMWDLYSIGYPGDQPTLLVGGAPLPFVNYVDEMGWVILESVIFHSPFGCMNSTTDNFATSITPFLLNMMFPPVPSAINYFCNVYNPWTPLGPLFGISLSPAYALPYARRLMITLNLPAGSPVATTTVFAAGIGRIFITNYDEFLKSVKKFVAEQMTGKKLDRTI